MRLSEKYRNAIVEEAHLQFGSSVSVMLFGSRTDNNLLGGDIDLLIIPQHYDSPKAMYEKKINFLIQLKNRIEEQKIDVVIAYKVDKREIVQTAKSEGVLLC